jgi:hypothetical protein
MVQEKFLTYAIIIGLNENVLNVIWNMNCENFHIEMKRSDEIVLRFVGRVDFRQYCVIMRMLKKVVKYSPEFGIIAFGYKKSKAPELVKFQKNEQVEIEMMEVLELEVVHGWKSL